MDFLMLTNLIIKNITILRKLNAKYLMIFLVAADKGKVFFLDLSDLSTSFHCPHGKL